MFQHSFSRFVRMFAPFLLTFRDMCLYCLYVRNHCRRKIKLDLFCISVGTIFSYACMCYTVSTTSLKDV